MEPGRHCAQSGISARLRGAALLACALVAIAPPALAGAAPGTLVGMVVAPDGAGARIRITISGPVHYMVSPYPDRIVVALDGIVAAPAIHHLAIGPVTGITVRPLHGGPARAEVVVTTRVPLSVAESFLDRESLVVRLAPRDAGPPGPHPGGRAVASEASAATVPSPAPASLPAPPGRGRETVAGRAVIPRTLRLEIGAGRVLEIDGLVRVAVGDPQVVGTVPVSSRELLVTGRAPGRTTMHVWEGPHRLLVYTVEVSAATDHLAELRRLLAALFPSAAIAVTEVASPLSSAPVAAAATTPPSAPAGPATPGALRASGPGSYPPPAAAGAPPAPDASASSAGSTLILSGAVDTQMDRRRLEEVARAFASRIVDLVSVRRPVQLKLQVRVIELSRSALQSLGITWGGGQQVPGAGPSLSGGVYTLQVLTAPAVGVAGLDLLIAQLEALTQRGLAHLLAEPSLVVLAGQPASLLLGGQVPIPVAGPNGTVTLDYKDFGVILNARLDYQDDGQVFMRLAPEVSTLDFSSAIKVSGFTIPTLRVRRAQTVVSMRPGQTLVLGGLLQRQDADLVQRIPVLGDLPIIGPLFRSRTFQHEESDLVIFVTPVLADSGGAPPPIPREEVTP